MFDFKEVGSQNLSFENIFIYEIEKSSLLRDLEAKCISGISYLTHVYISSPLGSSFDQLYGENSKGNHVRKM